MNEKKPSEIIEDFIRATDLLDRYRTLAEEQEAIVKTLEVRVWEMLVEAGSPILHYGRVLIAPGHQDEGVEITTGVDSWKLDRDAEKARSLPDEPEPDEEGVVAAEMIKVETI